jgi:hypothetical protein
LAAFRRDLPVVEAMFEKLQEVETALPSEAPLRRRRRRPARPEGREGLAASTRGAAPTAAPRLKAADATVDLFIDVPAHRVCLWGADIPIKPPKNLQRQLFFALTALALHAKEVVSMATLAATIHQLDRGSRSAVAPDARDLRYRMLRALRPHVERNGKAKSLDELLENIKGLGLRLNCTAQVIRAKDELPVTSAPATEG